MVSAKEAAAGFGSFLLGGAVVVVAGIAVAAFIIGGVWVSATLLPWLTVLTEVSFALVVFVILPLAIPKSTRGVSSLALLIASYVFGATLWMEGLLITFFTWGGWAVFIGLFIFGVGVVPIAMLASLLKAMWGPLIELVLLAVLTFASRAGALSLAESLEA
jgi:hypothetical protein